MLYLIISIVFYALNNLLWKKVLLQVDSWLVMSLRALLTSVMGVGTLFLYAPEIISNIDFEVICRVSFASILGTFGLICMISALAKGTLRQLGIFNIVIIVFTVSYLYLFEKFNFLDYLYGTSLIVLGFVIYMIQIKKLSTQESNIKIVILYVLMSLFFASSGIVHWNNLKLGIPPLFSVVNQELLVFIAGTIGLLIQNESVKSKLIHVTQQSYYLIFAMAVLIFAAVWSGFLGLKITNPYISSLLPLATPIVTIILGTLLFKEKWNKSIFLSLVLIVIGAFVLQFNLNQL
jgi:drug/metabolite transporter (DMT)-like permease